MTLRSLCLFTVLLSSACAARTPNTSTQTPQRSATSETDVLTTDAAAVVSTPTTPETLVQAHGPLHTTPIAIGGSAQLFFIGSPQAARAMWIVQGSGEQLQATVVHEWPPGYRVLAAAGNSQRIYVVGESTTTPTHRVGMRFEQRGGEFQRSRNSDLDLPELLPLAEAQNAQELARRAFSQHPAPNDYVDDLLDSLRRAVRTDRTAMIPPEGIIPCTEVEGVYHFGTPITAQTLTPGDEALLNAVLANRSPMDARGGFTHEYWQVVWSAAPHRFRILTTTTPSPRIESSAPHEVPSATEASAVLRQAMQEHFVEPVQWIAESASENEHVAVVMDRNHNVFFVLAENELARVFPLANGMALSEDDRPREAQARFLDANGDGRTDILLWLRFNTEWSGVRGSTAQHAGISDTARGVFLLPSEYPAAANFTFDQSTAFAIHDVPIAQAPQAALSVASQGISPQDAFQFLRSIRTLADWNRVTTEQTNYFEHTMAGLLTWAPVTTRNQVSAAQFRAWRQNLPRRASDLACEASRPLCSFQFSDVSGSRNYFLFARQENRLVLAGTSMYTGE